MEIRVSVKTAIIATSILASILGAAPDLFSQNFSACGTLQQGLYCMFFYPFGGGEYLLDNYGGFQPGDTVRVLGTYDLQHGPCLCWTFQYPCVHSNTISAGGSVCAPAACCVGTTGNLDLRGVIDLSDLSMLVAYLTGQLSQLPCVPAADINRSGVVDLADLSCLVSFLTGGGYQFPACPVGS